MSINTGAIKEAVRRWQNRGHTSRQCAIQGMILDSRRYCEGCAWNTVENSPCLKFRLDKLPIL
jgi:hypothetical protein